MASSSSSIVPSPASDPAAPLSLPPVSGASTENPPAQQPTPPATTTALSSPVERAIDRVVRQVQQMNSTDRITDTDTHADKLYKELTNSSNVFKRVAGWFQFHFGKLTSSIFTKNQYNKAFELDQPEAEKGRILRNKTFNERLEKVVFTAFWNPTTNAAGALPQLAAKELENTIRDTNRAEAYQKDFATAMQKFSESFVEQFEANNEDRCIKNLHACLNDTIALIREQGAIPQENHSIDIGHFLSVQKPIRLSDDRVALIIDNLKLAVKEAKIKEFQALSNNELSSPENKKEIAAFLRMCCDGLNAQQQAATCKEILAAIYDNRISRQITSVVTNAPKGTIIDVETHVAQLVDLYPVTSDQDRREHTATIRKQFKEAIKAEQNSLLQDAKPKIRAFVEQDKEINAAKVEAQVEELLKTFPFAKEQQKELMKSLLRDKINTVIANQQLAKINGDIVGRISIFAENLPLDGKAAAAIQAEVRELLKEVPSSSPANRKELETKITQAICNALREREAAIQAQIDTLSDPDKVNAAIDAQLAARLEEVEARRVVLQAKLAELQGANGTIAKTHIQLEGYFTPGVVANDAASGQLIPHKVTIGTGADAVTVYGEPVVEENGNPTIQGLNRNMLPRVIVLNDDGKLEHAAGQIDPVLELGQVFVYGKTLEAKLLLREFKVTQGAAVDALTLDSLLSEDEVPAVNAEKQAAKTAARAFKELHTELQNLMLEERKSTLELDALTAEIDPGQRDARSATIRTALEKANQPVATFLQRLIPAAGSSVDLAHLFDA